MLSQQGSQHPDSSILRLPVRGFLHRGRLQQKPSSRILAFQLCWTKMAIGSPPADQGAERAVTKRVFQSIDCGTSCVTCCAVLLEPQLLDIMIVQFRNEKVSNHGSIPITIDRCVVAFIVFEEGFHQPIKRTKQSVFLDVTVFRHTLVD
ncbi:hypothetical protein TNCV_3967741 [Trichonephila clavipes]|nr:hypothetical protein TNCV_3967741 [Trichonephila clavipes]